MFSFNTFESLKHTYKIVIPTTMYDRTAPFELVDSIVEHVKKEMAQAFGGFTESTAIGGYVPSSGILIEEHVYIIESSFKKENDRLIYKLAEKIKKELDQESVMIEKNGKRYFI